MPRDVTDDVTEAAGATLDGWYAPDWSDGSVAGSARDTADPERRVAVDILVDGEVVGRVRADRPGEDGAPATSFRFPLPDDLRGDPSRAVLVRFAETGAALRPAPTPDAAAAGPVDAAPPPEQGAYDGVLDAADEGGWIAGWARDLGRPDAVVEIEVLVDGTFVGRHPAVAPREDLAALGWGDCAYRLQLPSAYLDGREHAVEVRFAHDGAALRNSPRTFAARVPPSLTGILDAVEPGLVASGWARDTANPGRPVEIDVFVDGTAIGRFPANGARGDLAALGWPDCAFRVRLPGSYGDGTPHTVEVRFADGGGPLWNTPLEVAERLGTGTGGTAPGPLAPHAPPSPQLRGFFDGIEDGEWIAGWASPTGPDGPCVLEVLVDGAAVGTVAADQHRADLREHLGDCAFWFRIPRAFRDGAEHEVVLREPGTGATLEGSPRTFSVRPVGRAAGRPFPAGDDAAPAPVVAPAPNVFPNAALASWPNGLIVRPRERFEMVVDGWFYDRRRGTDPDIAFIAEKPVDVALGAGEYAMKVAVSAGGTDGYMRLVVPLPLDPDALRRHQLSIGVRNLSVPSDTSLHVAEIFLGAQTETTVTRLRTLRRAIKSRGTFRIAQLPLLPNDEPAVPEGARPCIVVELRGEGELLVFSPELRPAGSRRPGEESVPAGEFEDPRIREQARHLTLSPLWKPGHVVPGLPGGAPVPAAAAPREPRVYAPVPFIQIVVPVYNAALDVEMLLDSVVRSTNTPFEVLVFDDASGPHTASRIASWRGRDPRIRYFRNEENLGYTRNINRGLQSSVSDFVVLINSDTIVTARWLEKMYQSMILSERVGAVGPLSNAASWQSVPRTKSLDGDWIVNSFDAATTPDRISALLEDIHDGTAPDFPLLNGFCTLFRRSALEDVGYFDDASFPRGYGEENDLCLRLGRAGWILRVATDTYVHHSKSKSFGTTNRKELSKAANRILRDKHPEVSFNAIEERMRSDPSLGRIRRELAERLGVETFGLSTPSS